MGLLAWLIVAPVLIASLAGIFAFVLAANPHVALLGKFAIAVAVIAFVAGAMSYLAEQSLAALALRNEDFHWH